MTQLVLVRHGETVWHADNRYAGSSDIELTPRGHAQAAQLAEWCSTAGLAAVWTSTLSRARITASAGAVKAGVEMRVDERLRELYYGQCEGLTSAEIHERFPEARTAFEVDPAGNPLPGGEDPHQVATRFVAALDDICAAHPEGRVLVVAHSTAIRLALCRLIGVPLGSYRRLFTRLGNCTVTELRVRDGQVTMMQFNSPIGAVR
ncbi:histidine phosphatase family protein [Streptosporangium sp. NPDC001681]|uniref:histidine phosphatase family protein n=1 Tax=Streptosporangium sp. NPDC001681 TaxID=3154395 RepID=UPI0033314F6D